jgi:hypothetical protein
MIKTRALEVLIKYGQLNNLIPKKGYILSYSIIMDIN